jgi:hypothetical protein
MQAPGPVAAQGDQPPSYRAMVYSEAFAQRFALPKAGVQPLDKGLLAVVLRIVERPDDHPGCFLDLYLDDSLDLAFPEGSEGVMSRPDDENPFFFVRGVEALATEDHRWNAQLGSFHAVACHKTPESCMDEQSGPYAYARHLLPGVALQTYAPSCNVLDPQQGPTEIWLLRAGRDVKDLYPGSTDETGLYRFAMPAALFEHAAPRVRQAVKVYEDRPLGRQASRGQFTVPQTPQAR